MFQGLLLLIVVLAAIAVVGHGIWVFVAWILRGGEPARNTPAAAGTLRGVCPRCGLPMEGPGCRACDWPGHFGAASRRPLVALDVLTKQIVVASGAGVIDSKLSQRLLHEIAVERARLAAVDELARSAVAPAPEIFEAPILAESVEPQVAPVAPPHAPPVRPAAPREREFASTTPLHERAQRMMDRAAEAPPIVVAPAPPPRATWTDWLAAFMEERNIRWGELIGGLLIICGSIALVISFWSEIDQRPLLKFLLFNGVTAGLFGIGFYCEHRWRLRTTSQGLLTIASLLVPLNFLAIAAFTTGSAANSPLTIAGELFSGALFSALLYFASRILVERASLSLVCGVIVPSASQLLVRRFVEPGATAATLWSMALLPLACYLFVNGWTLARNAARKTLGEDDVNGLLKFLGITSFAAILPLGLIVLKTERPLPSLRELSMAVSLLGAVPLATGVVLWQRLAGGTLTALRTAGTAVGVFGAMLSLAGLVVGWPDPASMLPTALVEFVVFTGVAWWIGLPAAHLVAASCLAIGYLVGVYCFDGQVAWRGQDPRALAHAIVSGHSGALLVPLALAYAGAAFVGLRRGGSGARMLSTTGGALACASVLLAAISIALVSWFGFARNGDPFGAAWVYLVYATGAIGLAARSRRMVTSCVGAALLLAAIVQGVIVRYGDALDLAHAELTAILVYATVCGAIAAVVRIARLAILDSPLAGVMSNAALVGSLTATGWLIWLAPTHTAAFEAGHWSWLAAIWLGLALATGRRPVATLAQLALVFTTIFWVGAALEQRSWFAASRWPWIDPWTLQAVGIALVGLCLAWTALRIALARIMDGRPADGWLSRAHSLLATPWLAVDRATAAALIVLLVAVATYAAVPGASQELSQSEPVPVASMPPLGASAPATDASAARGVLPVETFALGGVSHHHAGQWGSWVLLAGVLVLAAAIALERRSPAWILSLLIVTAAACPLAASHFEGEVAVASALRWASTGFLVLASVPIWGRQWLAKWAASWGWPTLAADPRMARSARVLVFLLALAPQVAILATIGISALGRSPRASNLWDEWGLLAKVGVVVVIAAGMLWSLVDRLVDARPSASRSVWTKGLAALVIVLAIAPLVIVGLYEVGVAVDYRPIVGPDASSIFARMGPPASYGVPIIVLALVLVGYALVERSSGYGLAAGLMMNVAATAWYLLSVPAGGWSLDTVQWIRLAQLNASVAACYALLWLATAITARARRGERGPVEYDALVGMQLALAPALVALVLGWTWWDLFERPDASLLGPTIAHAEIVDAWGLISLALAACTVAAAAWAARWRMNMAGLSVAVVALAVVAAAAAARWDTGNWVAYNTLLSGHAVIAVVLLAIAWHDRRADAWFVGSKSTAWLDVARAILLVLAVRELPHGRWWPVAAFVVLALTGAAAGWLFQRRRYLYGAALMVNVAGSIAWLEPQAPYGSFEDFVYINVILLALPVIAWLVIEHSSISRREFRPKILIPPVHRMATRLAIFVLGCTAALGLVRDANQWSGGDAAAWTPWAALAATALAAIACLWDSRGRDAVARLYVLGLVAAAMLVDTFNLAPQWLLWTGNMVVAAYALATSYLWSRRLGLRQLADRLSMPRIAEGELAGLAWLVPCNLFLIAVVVLLTGIVELTEHDVSLRVLASQAVLTQVVSLALVARGDHRGVLQRIALALCAIGAVMFGWSWLDPATSGTLLNALVVMAAALAAVAVLYGIGLTKLLRETSDWLPSARQMTPVLAGIVAATIVVVLVDEIYQFAALGKVEIAWQAIVAVGATLLGLAVAALAAAILPGRDPLNMSERGRTLYVYGAEVLLALLFIHVRLTMPWLFSGFFRQYWPLVVMAIAFSGVGFAELCRRYRQNVLAEPVENTGALLPVLPVLGFWASDTNVHYSLLLMSVGVLYAGLSVMRRSFGFGLLAAIAANGGLWYFLNRQDGYGFLAHPQIWLIPPALCVLAAAYMNRSQLTDSQMTGLRYFSAMAIYLSSTADIFLNGVAQQPWLPVVLGGLALVGVFAGILLRVRAFLMLGIGFLGLALFTIIWHAAVDRDQTWIWWASAVIAGVLIIALFAIFEKKRNEVLEVLERIKQWEA